jgi:hypothetical protein
MSARLTAVVAACALTAASAGVVAAALAIRQIAANFELVQLAPNVYAFISNNTTHDWEDGNVTVILGTEAVAVIDAPAGHLAHQQPGVYSHLESLVN